DALENLRTKIDTIDAPVDLLSRKLSAITGGVETPLSDAKQQNVATTSSLKDIQTAAVAGGSVLDKLPPPNDTVRSALEGVAVQLATLTEGASTRIKTDLDTIATDVRTAKENLGTVASGVNEMLEFVNSRLR